MIAKKLLLTLLVAVMLATSVLAATGDNEEDHWYQMEDNCDDSAGSLDLTNVGASFVTGKVGSKAGDFEKDDPDHCGTSSFTTTVPTKLSVCFWHNAESTGGRPFNIERTGSSGNLIMDTQTDGTYMWVYVWDGTTNRWVRIAHGGTGTWNHWCVVADNDQNLAMYKNGAKTSDTNSFGSLGAPSGSFKIGSNGNQHDDAKIDDFRMWIDYALTQSDVDTLYNSGNGITGSLADNPPEIINYSLGSCTAWNTNKATECETTDSTPTININTDIDANCRIGVSDWNYTDLGSTRNCAGSATTSHTCTLNSVDELDDGVSSVYIGCQNAAGAENLTSTSGALTVEVTSVSVESSSRETIENAIEHALGRDYTIFTDQKVYVRNAANSQSVGTYDKVVKWMNKVWALNYLTGSDAAQGLFNITPVFYSVEISDMTTSELNQTIYDVIVATK